MAEIVLVTPAHITYGRTVQFQTVTNAAPVKITKWFSVRTYVSLLG